MTAAGTADGPMGTGTAIGGGNGGEGGTGGTAGGVGTPADAAGC